MTDKTTTNDTSDEELPKGLNYRELREELEEAREKTRKKAWKNAKIPGWAGDALADDFR